MALRRRKVFCGDDALSTTPSKMQTLKTPKTGRYHGHAVRWDNPDNPFVMINLRSTATEAVILNKHLSYFCYTFDSILNFN